MTLIQASSAQSAPIYVWLPPPVNRELDRIWEMTGNQELFVREGTYVDFDNLRTLRPQTCISSTMMDIYLRILVASCNKEAGDKKHALYINHVVMSKFQQADKNRTSTILPREYLHNIFEYKHVFINVNIGSYHYNLIELDVPSMSILMRDPLVICPDMKFIGYAKQYITQCRACFYPDVPLLPITGWEFQQSQFTLQRDGVSCGLFVTLYIKRTLANISLTGIDMSEIENLRRSMALTILSGYLVEHTYEGYTIPKRVTCIHAFPMSVPSDISVLVLAPNLLERRRIILHSGIDIRTQLSSLVHCKEGNARIYVNDDNGISKEVVHNAANINEGTQSKANNLQPNDRITVLPDIPAAPVSVKTSHVIPSSSNVQIQAIRKIQGYGNCFFRSVAFSTLEYLSKNNNIGATQRFKDLLVSALLHIRPYHRDQYRLVVDRVFRLLTNIEVLVMEFSYERNGIDAVLCDLIRIIVWEHVRRITKKNNRDHQVRQLRDEISSDEEVPLLYFQEHLTKIITNRTQVNSGVVRPAFEALRTSGDVLVQSPQGCTLQSYNSEAPGTDLIAKILLLNKDLHYEVLYAALAANPTSITGPNTAP